MNDEPVLPYAGTSGWSGSDTSLDRVLHEDSTGITSARQAYVMNFVRLAGYHGVTSKELRERSEWHHGQASGALSVLHKVGRLARLHSAEARRDRCAVYVTPDYINGRQTVAQGRRTKYDAGDVLVWVNRLALAGHKEASDLLLEWTDESN
jgi:hypothetical protein